MPIIKFYSKLDNQYRAFSNFYPAPFKVNNVYYETVEHFFQSMKFAVTDSNWAEKIRQASFPAQAARLGKNRNHPIEPGWNRGVKLAVMRLGLERKFQNHANLKRLLLRTADQELVEANPYDSYWGIGKGNGKNMTGRLLMELREKLR